MATRSVGPRPQARRARSFTAYFSLAQLGLRHRWKSGQGAVRIEPENRVGPLKAGILKPPAVERVIAGGVEQQPAQPAPRYSIHRIPVEIQGRKRGGPV